jgi:hypothetical protein
MKVSEHTVMIDVEGRLGIANRRNADGFHGQYADLMTAAIILNMVESNQLCNP